MSKVEIKVYTGEGFDGLRVVRISTAPVEFQKWLAGQTVPVLTGDPTPHDWAYASDWDRWIEKRETGREVWD